VPEEMGVVVAETYYTKPYVAFCMRCFWLKPHSTLPSAWVSVSEHECHIVLLGEGGE
jgi:hypothetical protein